MSSIISLRRTSMIWHCLLASLILIFVIVNARWIWLYRHGQPLDIDEAGYLIFAMVDYRGLLAGGLSGWLQAIEAPSIQAPLTTALASLIFFVGGPHVVAAFAVPVLAGTVTIAATYSLARSMLSPKSALAAATLVASCPTIINYARSFHFALPTTAVTTLALLCLVRSERFSNARWALLFGVFLGLMPLARTMTIAFIPGILLGAAVHIISDYKICIKRVRNFLLSIFAAGITASSWLALNGSYVFSYLFNFGYGKNSAEYGSGGTSLGLSSWIETLNNLVGNIYVPHALVLLAGLASMAVLVVAAARRYGRAAALHHVLKIPALPIVIFLAGSLAALTSSQNKGTGFVTPLVPAMLVVSVYLITTAWKGRVYSFLLRTGLLLVCLISTVPLLDLASPLARRWPVTIPWLWQTIVTDGRGNIHQYEDFGGLGRIPGMAQPVSRTEGRAWVALNKSTADTLWLKTKAHSPVAFGFRGFLYNTNTINLQVLLAGFDLISLVQIDPSDTENTQAGYNKWLTTGQASTSCLLLTLREDKEDIEPSISKRSMEAAARQAGFVTVQDWPTPDGNIVTMWQRDMLQPACPAG